MRESYGALVWRAGAALAVSVALHLAAVGLGGSSFLGALRPASTEGDAPLIVDVVAAPARRALPPVRAATGRSPERRAIPPALPPIIPIVTEHEIAAPEAFPPAGGPGVALDVASPEADVPAADGTAAGPGAPPPDAAPAPDAVQVAAAPVPVTRQPPPAAAGPGGEAGAEPPHGAEARPAAEETAFLEGPVLPAPDGGEAAALPDPRVSLARLDEVTRNPSVAARAEGQPFVGRREVFEFLLDHPDFATHVTRVLRLARYRMWRTDDGLFVDDGWGATGQVFVVHAASGQRVLYARGEFQSKLLPAIHGEAVVTIDYDAQPAGDGRDLLFAAISSQLKIEGVLGDLVATIANSVATEKAEKESRRLVRIFARVLRAVDEAPAALYASLRGRPDVPPRELEQFRALLKLP